MDGYFVDFGGLSGLHARFSELQSNAGSFFRGLGALHPQAIEFPAVAADSKAQVLRHSAEAVTAAGLLGIGHQSTTQRIHTMDRNYTQAEQANADVVTAGGADDADATGTSRPSSGPLVLGGAMTAGAAIASLTGMMRAARLGRSLSLPLGGSIGSLGFNVAALIVLIENYRDAEGWEERASAAAQVKKSVSGHQDAGYEGVRVSNDHLDGSAGDAFRTSVTSHIAAPYGVLAAATGEMSNYSSAAADAQRTFNQRITTAAVGLMAASTTLAILAPPLQMAVSAFWYAYVCWCRDELKKGFDGAAAHLTQTGSLTDENERLRRAVSAPNTVQV